jgi:CheY-like chemotaxis protein
VQAQLETGPRPDLITIDGDMPGVSGFELSASLCDTDAIAAIPRVLLTASYNPADGGHLRAAGFCAAFTKPVSTQELQRIFSSVLGAAAPAPVPSPIMAAPSPELAALRVLVAEDNVINRQVIDAMLKKLGVQAQLVHNGLEAVTAVLAAAQPWHLILMDCEMPELDGYAAARRIRAHEAGKGQPRVLIVALSAHALDEHRAHSQAAGMDAHLTKPINLQALRELLQQLQID